MKLNLHPGCGCCPTQNVAKFIAVCDLVFGLAGIFWFVYILEDYDVLMHDPSIFGKDANADATNLNLGEFSHSTPILITPNTTINNMAIRNDSRDLFLSHGIAINQNGIQVNGQSWNIVISGFYTMVNLIAFVLLLSAAHEKNILKLKIWLIIRISIFCFKLLLYTMYVIIGAPLFEHIPHIIFMGIHFYGFWVVLVFIKEIRKEQEEQRQQIQMQMSVTEPELTTIITVTGVDEDDDKAMKI